MPCAVLPSSPVSKMSAKVVSAASCFSSSLSPAAGAGARQGEGQVWKVVWRACTQGGHRRSCLVHSSQPVTPASPSPSLIQVRSKLPPLAALVWVNLAAYSLPEEKSRGLSATKRKKPTLVPSSVAYLHRAGWAGCSLGQEPGHCSRWCHRHALQEPHLRPLPRPNCACQCGLDRQAGAITFTHTVRLSGMVRLHCT